MSVMTDSSEQPNRFEAFAEETQQMLLEEYFRNAPLHDLVEPWEWHTLPGYRRAAQCRPSQKARRHPRQHVPDNERCDVAQAQSMAANGKLPGAAKINRRWTFDPAKLRQFVRNKEREAWQSGKHHPDVTGEGIPSGAGLRSAGGSSVGRLTQLIRASQKRASKLARRGW